MFLHFGLTPTALLPAKESNWLSFPFKVIVGNFVTPKLSPKASFTAAASHEPDTNAPKVPSFIFVTDAAPSGSEKNLGLLFKSTKYSVASGWSPKVVPASASVPSGPNNSPPAA